MNIEESLKRKKVQFLIKRVFDFFASAAGLIFLSPAFLVIALLIKKSSPGPVFFRQVRVGKDQKPFEIYKFRTMAMRREEGKKITVGKDRRITSIGSVLRKYKLDEFPQLINVFKGEMSLVGPRPEVPEYVNIIPKRNYRCFWWRRELPRRLPLSFEMSRSS
ncbi:bacterial sugar transferase [Peptostreptococcaceae bacterium oral taxon 113 str. W5053]|nr:bacterial sugar transferase [Peptostreptococcaceae bacterium oral taxon 113 str. W5053]